jgi:D-glycero-D-manno-heptose 1,7-bisphosphate phosphatase
MKLKAVFLDKDGILIPGIPYNAEDNNDSLNEGLVEGLQLLQSYGYLLVIVANQAGLAQGDYTEQELDGLKSKIKKMCSKIGIYLDGFYYCPHHPNGKVPGYASDCECRKPQPGLLLKAAGDMDIDLSSSWMIGDILNDVEAGNRAGCKTILINNGNETEWCTVSGNVPQYRARDLAEAARYILTMN